MFDKTGTLTMGKPVVVNTKIFRSIVLREFYKLVAAAEVHYQPLLCCVLFSDVCPTSSITLVNLVMFPLP